MIFPNGNCRHCSQSGSIVNQKHVFIRDDNVVCKLILGYYFGNDLWMDIARRLRRCPRKSFTKRTVLIDLCGESCKSMLR